MLIKDHRKVEFDALRKAGYTARMSSALADLDVFAMRAYIRAGQHVGHTAGFAPGRLQANIVIVPQAWADTFGRFCERNAQACPVLARSDVGDPRLPSLGSDIDLRYDLPRYQVFRAGSLQATPICIDDIWRNDLVAFALGCSFTFEHALVTAGLEPRHIQLGRNVAMYKTNRPMAAEIGLRGPLVVSMRPYKSAQVAQVMAVTRDFPGAHGVPVHTGDALELGITQLTHPDFGDAVPLEPDDVPVFWACGVSAQVALQQSAIPFFITHAPGCMLLTDVPHVNFGEPRSMPAAFHSNAFALGRAS